MVVSLFNQKGAFMLKRILLNCYVCGKLIQKSEEFAITSMTKDGVDRVFLVHTGDCLEDLGEDSGGVIVKETDKRGAK
jgi:hypothetical protein